MVEGPVPFGRYQLVNLLGEGGMAKVYRAMLSGPLGFEKEVAVKRIDAKVTADERIVKSLINEARLGGQLRHKNIVEIYEFNQVNGQYYMAMEYVNGWTLDFVLRVCRDQKLFIPPLVVCEIMENVCKGLDYAHTLKAKDGTPLRLVHRDLKPGNIIISREGDTKIMDFGIAKADTNLYKTTAADVTKGTPIYMSPEQVTGGDLDQRSDIFSLGSVLHELLTNQVPFQGDNLLAIMHAVLNAEIEDACARVREKSPPLEEVLRRCMAKEKEARYENARELSMVFRTIGRQIDGPPVIDWIEELVDRLPAVREPGDFGPDGAPAPAFVGTQSMDPVGSIGSVSDVVAPGHAPKLTAGGEDIDSYAETMAMQTSGSSFPAGQDLMQPPGAGQDEGVGGMNREVDAPPPHRGSGGDAARTGGKKKRGRRQKRKPLSRGQKVALVVAGITIVASLSFILFQPRRRSPVESTVPASNPEDAAEEAAAGLAAGFGGAKSAPPTSKQGEPASAKPTPHPKPPPRVESTPTPKPKVAANAAPAPGLKGKPKVATKPKPKEKPKPKGRGTLHINSKPWSNLYLDGKPIGQTPKIKYELPAGSHRLEFQCGSCDPPQNRVINFDLANGDNFKRIVRFEQPRG